MIKHVEHVTCIQKRGCCGKATLSVPDFFLKITSRLEFFFTEPQAEPAWNIAWNIVSSTIADEAMVIGVVERLSPVL